MKISIITVTLNAAAFLDDCINSVISQEYEDIEYILIDGVSSDQTLDIVNRYKEHIHHFVSEKDENQYEALNKGIRLATGDVIGILNADDYLADSQVIKDIAKVFTESGCDIVYGDLDYVNRDHTGKVLRKWRSEPFKQWLLKWGWMPAHPTWYVKKSVLDKNGGYKTGYGSSCDYELMLRLMSANLTKCFYLRRVLVKMRAGGTSNVSFINRMRAVQSDFRAMKDNGLKFPFLATLSKRMLKLPQFVFFKGQ